jgi:hypothetical protein
MKRIIFLDFDGVLTVRETRFNTGHPNCVAALNRIIEATDADIVVSSTWRSMGIATCIGNLRRWGVRGEVVGLTPHHPGGFRGAEIQEWLDSHGKHVASFVILDDDQDMGETLMPKLVKTTCATGLCMEDAEKAIALLNA